MSRDAITCRAGRLRGWERDIIRSMIESGTETPQLVLIVCNGARSPEAVPAITWMRQWRDATQEVFHQR